MPKISFEAWRNSMSFMIDDDFDNNFLLLPDIDLHQYFYIVLIFHMSLVVDIVDIHQQNF